jgi:2,3-bisphosphoglycerate-dependent phosphoglycerate mutase
MPLYPNRSAVHLLSLSFCLGIPIVYDLDADLKPIPSKDAIAPLTARFCGDQEAARAAMAKVAAQGKAKPA